MSDRREQVARAIQEAASTRTPYNNWLNMADAAIAAMQDAEPTEAEIEAAAIGRYVQEFDAPQDWAVEQEEHKAYWREEGRKSLIAARKDRQ